MTDHPPVRKPKRGGGGVPTRLRVLHGGSPTPEPSFRLLTQVSAALSTSLDLDRTLREVLERLNQLVAFDAASLFLLDDARTELRVKAAIGVAVALKEVNTFKIGEGVVGWVVEHGTTALIEDSAKDARYKPTGTQRAPKTVLAAPLKAQQHVLGALVLVRAAREPFKVEHQRLVEAIASQAAVAIDHARLYETERGSRRRAEALLAAAQACSEAVATPELLRRAVKQVAFAMRATGAAVFLADEQGQTLEAAFEASDTTGAELQELIRQPIGTFALGRALITAERPAVFHASDAAGILPASAWSRLDARAAVVVPIRWQGRLVAALLVGFANPERIEGAELELLEEIGRQVALGIERLRLQARVQEQQSQMSVVSERNRIARDMHDGIVQYVYALGLGLEQARDLVAQAPDAARLLTTAVEQVNHVLSEMRTFIYQLRPIIMQEKEIGQWVEDLCRQFQQATGVTVVTAIGPPAGHELSPEISIAIFRIIQEALSNIYKHARANRARLSLDFTEAAVRLSIEDDGRGLGGERRRGPGIGQGRGLRNIEERVADLGGVLTITGAAGEGTRLEAVFPYERG